MLRRPRPFPEQQVCRCTGCFKTLVSTGPPSNNPDDFECLNVQPIPTAGTVLSSLVKGICLLFRLFSWFVFFNIIEKAKHHCLYSPQEEPEHVSRNGLQQHLGDAGRHDLWTYGHGCCHDIPERIPADMPEVWRESSTIFSLGFVLVCCRGPCKARKLVIY